MLRRVAVIAVVLLLASCHSARQEPLSPAQYEESIQAWHTHREDGLRSPDGWLTLAGLFWLTPGEHTIGAGEENEFALPKGTAPAKVGRLQLEGNKITFCNDGGNAVTVNGRTTLAPVALSYDDDKPDVVGTGSLSLTIIKRVDRYAVRVRNRDSRVLRNFTGTQFFPTDPKLHFADAKLISDPKRIPILNITGQTDLEESPGIVEFQREGQTYRLRPIYEGKTLYFLFKDPTNKTETYQAGRMLNTPLPVNGRVDLDFNRSYNPPCTFTPYATCPLPPRENTLTFAVTAGEKRYGHGRPEL